MVSGFEIASAGKMGFSMAVTAGKKIKEWYTGYRDAPKEVADAIAELEKVQGIIDLEQSHSVDGIKNKVPGPMRDAVTDSAQILEQTAQELLKLVPSDSESLRIRDKGRWAWGKPSTQKLLDQMQSETNVLAQRIHACVSVFDLGVNQGTRQVVQQIKQQQADTRQDVQQIKQQQIDTHRVLLEELVPYARNIIASLAQPSPSRQGEQEFIAADNVSLPAAEAELILNKEPAIDAIVDCPLPRFYDCVEIQWLNAVIVRHWDRYKSTWEFSANVALPKFLRTRFRVRASFEKRACLWGVRNIKLSSLHPVTSINPASELWEACFKGDVETVRLLIEEKGQSPFGVFDERLRVEKPPWMASNKNLHLPSRFISGDSLLAPAVHSGKQSLVRYLLRVGLDADHKNDMLRGALFLAFKKGEIQIARDLINHGAAPNEADKYGVTAMELLLGESRKTERALEEGKAPTSAASEDRALEFVDLLATRDHAYFDNMESPTNIYDSLILTSAEACLNKIYAKLCRVVHLPQTIKKTITTFGHAAQGGNIILMKEILNQFPTLGMTYAGAYESPVLTTLLMAEGKPGNKISPATGKPKFYEIMDILLDRGVDVNAPDAIGRTALHYSMLHQHPDSMTELLIAHGAQVNQQCKAGMTAMHAAAITCSPRAIRTLHRHGADVNARTYGGLFTPLHYLAATRWQSLEPENGLTPAEAVREAVYTLLESGADPRLLSCSTADGGSRWKRLGALAHAASIEQDKSYTPGHLAWRQGGDKVIFEAYAASLKRFMEVHGCGDDVVIDEQEGDIFWTSETIACLPDSRE